MTSRSVLDPGGNRQGSHRKTEPEFLAGHPSCPGASLTHPQDTVLSRSWDNGPDFPDLSLQLGFSANQGQFP